MQRPEAWPRPHPGEGAAAAPTGGPAPPARAGEPAGLRVRSGRRRGPGGASSRVGRRGTWCRRDWPGRGGARAAEKFLRADSGGGRCGVRVGEVLELSERAGDDSAGLDCVSPGGLGSAGPPRRRADVCASGARRARAPGAAGGARRRCPPGPGSVIHSDSGSGAVSA